MRRTRTAAPLPPSAYHMTLDECGEVLGVTRESIRQIEVKALKKLRYALACQGLTLADLLPPDADRGEALCED